MPFLVRIAFITWLLIPTLFAQDLKPLIRLQVSGFVNDFIVDGATLYVATTEGVVEIFDLYSKKKIDKIVLPLIESGRGEMVVSKVLSIDYLNGKLLLVTSASKGRKNIWIYEDKKLRKVAQKSADALVKKARFLDDENYLFATFDSDVIKYQTQENYEAYHRQMTQSRLSDIALSEDRSVMAMADESGEVRLIDTATSQEIAMVGALNLDNVYKVVFKEGTILTGGQDRRVGVYVKGQKPYYIQSNFLVYCVGICDDAGMGAYSSGFDHDIQLFEIKSKKKIYRLVGHKSVINKILFFTETIIVSAGDEREVLIWQLPKAHR